MGGSGLQVRARQDRKDLGLVGALVLHEDPVLVGRDVDGKNPRDRFDGFFEVGGEIGAKIVNRQRERGHGERAAGIGSTAPLGDRVGHFAAGFGAGATGLGAFLAVVDAVFAALGAAGVADLRAEGADLRGELGAARHLAGGERAEVGAAAVEFDAAGHHVDVGLGEAGGGAAFAGVGAAVAGLDAIVKGQVVHDETGDGGWVFAAPRGCVTIRPDGPACGVGRVQRTRAPCSSRDVRPPSEPASTTGWGSGAGGAGAFAEAES